MTTLLASATGFGSVTLDTTGAGAIVVLAVSDAYETITNNGGGAAYELRPAVVGVGQATRVWAQYKIGATGARVGHTFSATASYTRIMVLAYDTLTAFESELPTPNGGAVNSLQMGSVTPAGANRVLMSAVSLGNDQTGVAINDGYTIVHATPGTHGQSYGGAVGHFIGATEVAHAPTWTWGGTAFLAMGTHLVFSGTAPAAGVPPEITSHPSSTTAAIGASVSFSVVATGPGLSYQWERSTDGGVTWAAVVGATGSSYAATASISGGTANNQDRFRCVVSGSAPPPATSNAAILTVSALAIGLVTASVQANGAAIDLTFSSGGLVNSSDVSVEVNGYLSAVTATTGGGTTWVAKIGRRHALVGAVVTVAYQGGTAVNATNASAITRIAAEYAGRKKGLFLHWNIETYIQGSQWSGGNEDVNIFSPTGDIGSAIDQWIAGALSAGMKYIVLTVKHHGGFCLWPTATSPRTIGQTAWYSASGSPDILRMYCDKVRAAGIGVGLYFSIWDRWWELTNPAGTPAAYEAFIKSQITEILSNYGRVECLWLDGWGWMVQYTTIPYAAIADHVHSLQPDCLIINNDHAHALATTDFPTYEFISGSTIPPGNLAPAEFARTIATDPLHWFFWTGALIPLSTIQSEIADVWSKNSNYLLNCSPTVTGKLLPEVMRRLAEIGADEPTPAVGISAATGSLAQRTVTLTLTNAASLSGLSWSWHDEPKVELGRSPVAQGKGATTSAGGVLTLSVPSRLAVGGVGRLRITNSTGAAGVDFDGFDGPVVVA